MMKKEGLDNLLNTRNIIQTGKICLSCLEGNEVELEKISQLR